jgi:hypothetical protein
MGESRVAAGEWLYPLGCIRKYAERASNLSDPWFGSREK